MPTSLAAMLTSINDGGANTAAEMRAVITALYDWIPPLEKYKMGRLAGETAHASDDFFSTITGYTEVDVTGTTTWSSTRAGATCVFAGQSSNDFSCLLKAIPAAGLPTTIETRTVATIKEANNPMYGLLFTDGTASTSNLMGVGVVGADTGVPQLYNFSATIGTVTANLMVDTVLSTEIGNPFIRLTCISANNFGWSLSPDSENWTDFAFADLTPTLTPTHMGFFVSSWNGAGNQIASFNYLRVYDADLSV